MKGVNMKIVKVNKCLRCPYFLDVFEFVCTFNGCKINDPYKEDFPDGCALNDEQETK
jgi:hypothetical protein